MRNLQFLIVAAAAIVAGCTAAGSRERQEFSRVDERRAASLADAFRAARNNPEPAPVATATGVVKLDSLVREAELHSPRLLAAFNKWKAAVSGITASYALPDASFSYTYFIDSIETRLGPIEHRFMLEQMVPNPGKLVAREAAAAGNAQAMRANFEATRLGLRESLVVAYAELQSLEERIKITREMAAAVRDIESVVEARVTSALVPQSALLRVQVEAERLESDARALEKRRPALIAALEAVAGVDLPDRGTAEPFASSTRRPLPDKARLVAYVLGHPSVELEFARQAIASAKVDEAGWMWVPDLMFGVEYEVMVSSPSMPAAMSTKQAIAVKVGISVPWQFHVNIARGDAARAEEQAAKFMVQQQKLDMTARLAMQEFAYEDAERLVELYEDTVLPKARQTLELIRTDYTSDRATLTDVLDSERALLAAELSLINARADLAKARARIESLVARDLETIK